MTYDHTWQEIKDAYDAGLPVYLQTSDKLGEIRYYLKALENDDGYTANFIADSHTSDSLYANTQNEPMTAIHCQDK